MNKPDVTEKLASVNVSASVSGSPTMCKWFERGEECDELATHTVTKPGRSKMPVCAEHAAIYSRKPTDYQVEKLENAAMSEGADK